MSVLVVDDDLDVLATVGQHLEDAGHSVTTASNCMIALEIIEHTAFDVMIIDCVMPVGTLRGAALGRMVNLRDPTVRLIFISGHANIALVDGHLPGRLIRKPFALRELDAAINAALSEAGPDPALDTDPR